MPALAKPWWREGKLASHTRANGKRNVRTGKFACSVLHYITRNPDGSHDISTIRLWEVATDAIMWNTRTLPTRDPQNSIRSMQLTHTSTRGYARSFPPGCGWHLCRLSFQILIPTHNSGNKSQQTCDLSIPLMAGLRRTLWCALMAREFYWKLEGRPGKRQLGGHPGDEVWYSHTPMHCYKITHWMKLKQNPWNGVSKSQTTVIYPKM